MRELEADEEKENLEEGEVIKASRVKEFIKLLKEYVIISKKNLDADVFLIKIIDTLAEEIFNGIKMVRCDNCGDILTEEQKNNDWKFGKIWFCRTTCAVRWCVNQHLSKAGERKHDR